MNNNNKENSYVAVAVEDKPMANAREATSQCSKVLQGALGRGRYQNAVIAVYQLSE
jgi:hypothetical protein